MTFDPDTQKRLRLYNKINKLVIHLSKKDKITPFDAQMSLSLCLGQAAAQEGTTPEHFEILLDYARKQLNAGR